MYSQNYQHRSAVFLELLLTTAEEVVVTLSLAFMDVRKLRGRSRAAIMSWWLLRKVHDRAERSKAFKRMLGPWGAVGMGGLHSRWSWQVTSPDGNSHAGASVTCEQQITGLAKLERHQFFFLSNFAVITCLRLEFCVSKQSEKLLF